MKKLIFLLLLMVALPGFSQSKFQGFFKPVPADLIQIQLSGISGKSFEKQSLWIFRPKAGVIATRHTYYKDTKSWVTTPLAAVGVGAGYQHFTQLPTGEPFNDFGINLLLLTDTQDASMGLGLFGTFFGWINLGADYSFALKKVSIDTGVTIKF